VIHRASAHLSPHSTAASRKWKPAHISCYLSFYVQRIKSETANLFAHLTKKTPDRSQPMRRGTCSA
jgi:hypothetical protein